MKKIEINKGDIEHLKEYHQLQYERIDKLEEQRFNFANLILTLGTFALTFGYKDASIGFNNAIQKIAIPLLLLISNIAAIIFIFKTREFIKMHQKRAEIARELYAPVLNQINENVTKIDSGKDIIKRSNLHIYLHGLFIIIALSILIYGFSH
ncbi:hypothetical protein H6804_00130 [Candidatus Nomurabacteria bacterium]|nr:hypothetical protein [Candidatus Nomurabacteria bacterium]